MVLGSLSNNRGGFSFSITASKLFGILNIFRVSVFFVCMSGIKVRGFDFNVVSVSWVAFICTFLNAGF